MNLETRTVEQKYVVFEEQNEEFPASVTEDILNALEGTSVGGGLYGTTGTERKLLEFFRDIDLVGHTHKTGYFVKDDEVRQALLDELYDCWKAIYE